VQSGTINIWGVQLEIGSVMTPLEKPDPRYDLSNCQRFYCAGNVYFAGAGIAANSCIQSMALPVEMRALPTCTANFTTQTNCSGGVVAALNHKAVYASAAATASTQTVYVCNFTASADL
jgi:hypothetical protein